MKPPPYDYVRRYYDVDPVVGARVRFTDSRKPRFGVIAREPGSSSQYVYVHFDGERHAVPCHPTSLDYNPTEPTLVSLAAERDALKAEVEALRRAVEKAEAFVSAIARMDPVFAKGAEKTRIANARDLLTQLRAAREGRSALGEEGEAG